MTIMVDPPSGWKYGFPRIYDKEKDGDLGQFLVDKGYPVQDVDFALRYIRFCKVEDTSSQEDAEMIYGREGQG